MDLFARLSMGHSKTTQAKIAATIVSIPKFRFLLRLRRVKKADVFVAITPMESRDDADEL